MWFRVVQNVASSSFTKIWFKTPTGLIGHQRILGNGLKQVCLLNFMRLESSNPPPEPERKYKKPVDWLPFPWHRRPRFNVCEKSGDVVKELIVDEAVPKPGFELSEELRLANERVKKVFSIETANQNEIREAKEKELLKLVQRHPMDFDSIEVKIALMTVRIQNLFRYQFANRKQKRNKVRLRITIQKRNRLLKFLYRSDTERFSWLVKVLQLKYEPEPFGYRNKDRYCKKWDLRRLTREYCENMKNEKTAAFHKELVSQQHDFLCEKEETLAWIAKEEEDLSKFPDLD